MSESEVPEFPLNVTHEPQGGTRPRTVRAKWSLQDAQTMLNEFACADLGTKYDFIPPVRLWQFWRWHLTWREDYVLSRAGEIVYSRRIAEVMRAELGR